MELNFQYAHHIETESESRAIQSASDVLVAFDTFDWASEIEQANQLQNISPTLSLIIDRNNNLIWVSAYGDPSSPKFVSSCRFSGLVSGFLGFGKKPGIVDLHAGSFSKSQARKALELFVNNDHDGLQDIYKGA